MQDFLVKLAKKWMWMHLGVLKIINHLTIQYADIIPEAFIKGFQLKS